MVCRSRRSSPWQPVFGGGEERRSLHGARPQYRAADHLQLRRPDAGARDPQGELQAGREPAAIQLGQHAHRPHVGRAAVSHPRREADLLDTTFPHAKPQMLYWNVQSEMDGEATVEITYFTSGISWSADYIVHRQPGRDGDGPRRFRPRVQQFRRRVRGRPGPAGRRPDQPGARRSPSWPRSRCRSVDSLEVARDKHSGDGAERRCNGRQGGR